MAEGVVGLLIGKLGVAMVNEAAHYGASLLCQEAAALKGLFSQIGGVKGELESMQAYLQDAERFKDTDATTGIFIRNIRELAFQIEDIVEEFTYKLEDKHGGFPTKMKKRIEHVQTWHRLARELQGIKFRLVDANRRKEMYKYNMEGPNKEGESSSRYKFSCQSFHLGREKDLVGIKENKEILIGWLTVDSEQGRRICTVWGMGGIGKTTLVTHVYNIVKVDYDTAAWITVSKNYRVEDLLRRIVKEFRIPVDDVADLENTRLLEVIHYFLQGKRYLLVLDDVWGVDVWFNIMNAFPTDNSIGRFVITSRISDVALLGNTTTRKFVIHLKQLGKDHSMELFCKEAFWKNEDKECPSELYGLAHLFLEKCNGLPIAIACIGRLLSCKPNTQYEWENVYKMLKSQLTENVIIDVNIVLKVSLEDLPYDLKNCFMHCLVFPEQHLIKRKRAIRHWIAAGFIKVQENITFEEVAENYLNELVNRSLLQVVESSAVGRVKSCRMHGIIRLLALIKANEECFCKDYDGSGSFSVGATRRLSIQSTNIEQLNRSNPTYLREIHTFESNISLRSLKPILRSSFLLSTLDLQGCHTTELPNEVFNLFNLRYLGLRCTGISNLPEAVGRLQNLEVLDACNGNLSFFPKNVRKLRRLRFLHACTALGGHKVEPFSGVEVPNGIRHLTGLQALQCVKANKGTLCEVGYLAELRTFGVSNVKSEHSTILCKAISKMNHLVHLEITALHEEVLQLGGLHLPPTLSWLGLEGQLEKISMSQVLSSWSHLNNLTRLKLSFSKLDEESFYSLLPLHGLRRLSLCKAYEGKKLQFNTTSFPKLRHLFIWDAPHLNQVIIEEGAMPSLDVLGFKHCPELNILPDGIVHLSALTELHLEDTAEELVEKLCGKGESDECDEYHRKIKHIRKITVVLTKSNIEERILNRLFPNYPTEKNQRYFQN